MKKIYSFVLMAAMLLVGTSAWAENELRVGSQYYSDLQAAFNAASDGATIYLEDNLSTNVHATLDADKYIILDLGTYELTFNCADAKKNVAILIKQGRLMIQNGTISNASNGAMYTVDLIRLNGTTAGIDAKVETPYSQVIVAANATLKNDVTLTVSGQKANVLTIAEANGTNNLANGARIDVYGTLEATTYGIKVNGNIVAPANTNHSPYIYIHAGADVKTNDTGTGAVAAYSSGYGRWRIEGTCQGSTGLYAKGGQVEIVDNAVVKSNNSGETTTQTGLHSGVSAGGSAIVVESNAAYPGQITVVISGNATVEGNSGYAIEETVDNAVTGTKVETISIQGGTIDGGDKGAIVVDEKTNNNSEHHVTIVGGQVEGTLAIETTTKTVEEFIQGTSTTDPKEEADYLVTKNTDDPSNPIYVVEPNLSKVITLNADGYTTFSAAYVRSIKADDYSAGLKAYYAEYTEVGGEQSLVLHELNKDHVIPAGLGVIFKGAANQTYSLLAAGSAIEDYSDNALSPATAWSGNEPANGIIAGEVHANAYVLSGNMMYKYEGANMKANKAYLDLGTNPAPKRIKMVFAETQDIENVEFEAVKAVKFIENGQVLIKRGENIYNVQGQIVK